MGAGFAGAFAFATGLAGAFAFGAGLASALAFATGLAGAFAFGAGLASALAFATGLAADFFVLIVGIYEHLFSLLLSVSTAFWQLEPPLAPNFIKIKRKWLN